MEDSEGPEGAQKQIFRLRLGFRLETFAQAQIFGLSGSVQKRFLDNDAIFHNSGGPPQIDPPD